MLNLTGEQVEMVVFSSRPLPHHEYPAQAFLCSMWKNNTVLGIGVEISCKAASHMINLVALLDLLFNRWHL